MALCALKVGIDVPWVTSWSGEPVLGIRPCGSVGGRLAIVQAQDAVVANRSIPRTTPFANA